MNENTTCVLTFPFYPFGVLFPLVYALQTKDTHTISAHMGIVIGYAPLIKP